MSLDVRKLTNGRKQVIVVTHTDTGDREIYKKECDVPKEIRHYIPESALKASPASALWCGCFRELYPNWPNCGMDEYKNSICLGDECVIAEGHGGYQWCPFYKNEVQG